MFNPELGDVLLPWGVKYNRHKTSGEISINVSNFTIARTNVKSFRIPLSNRVPRHFDSLNKLTT
jgi:hypothetical protein